MSRRTLPASRCCRANASSASQRRGPAAGGSSALSCHGPNGIGVTPMYPSLAGQHASYLARAIQEYQTGYRKNPIMNGMVASLKPADITAIADYFSSLEAGTPHGVPAFLPLDSLDGANRSRRFARPAMTADSSRGPGSGPGPLAQLLSIDASTHFTCTGTKIRALPRWISRATWPCDFSTAERSCSTLPTRWPLAASTTSPG